MALETLAAGALGLLLLCNIAAAVISRQRRQTNTAAPRVDHRSAAVGNDEQKGSGSLPRRGPPPKTLENGSDEQTLFIQARSGPAPPGGCFPAPHKLKVCRPFPVPASSLPFFDCSSHTHTCTASNGALDKLAGPLQL